MSFVRYFLLLIFALLARSAFAQPAAELHPVLNLPSGGAWNMCTSPEGHVYAATSGGLLRFADSTWELVTPDLIGRVTTVTADGADGLIIGTLDGRLFRTALRESIEWKFLLSSNKSEDLVANSMGVVLAGFYEGVYTSTDHGQTWKQGLTDGPRLRTVGVGDSLLVAFGTKSGSFTRMWTSTDLGNSWDSVTYVNGNAGSPQDVIIDKQGRIVVAALYDGVKLSSDTGKTWVELNEGLGDTVAATRIIEDLDGTLFIATWQDGIFRRGIKDSAWSSSNAGLFDPKLLRTDPASAESFAIALDSSANLYASTSSTFARAQRGDVIWTRLTRGFRTPHITALESFGDPLPKN